jgi:aspartyl-tRNA(Asn)/glutamyl-tRNA(Gln) amidotransferase subunit C
MSSTFTSSDVAKLAELARLALSPEELEKFAAQIGDIFDYFEQMQALDTEGVAPIVHPLELTNVMREDIAAESLPQDVALSNAHRREDGSFVVPQIFGDEGE